jgi:hypothetical protein
MWAGVLSPTELAGLSRPEFLDELARRKVPVIQMTVEELSGGPVKRCVNDPQAAASSVAELTSRRTRTPSA